MTLRNVRNWVNDFGDIIERDIDIVFSENILDWPIWTVVVVAILGVTVFVFVKVVLESVPSNAAEKIGSSIPYVTLSVGTSLVASTAAESFYGLKGGIVNVVSLVLSFALWAVIFGIKHYLRKHGREKD